MTWVLPHSQYIRVDADGTLTFLVPKGKEDVTAPLVPKAKVKEKLPKGVPAIGTIVAKYFRDWTGGTPADLARKIQFKVKGEPKKVNRGEPSRVVSRLKEFIESHFADQNKRGKQKNDE